MNLGQYSFPAPLPFQHYGTLGAPIASASTVNLDNATGDYVHITGTTTITTITLAAGKQQAVVFDGILTLTQNATSLILPGAANVTTAAGDTALFVGEGGGNTRCIGYSRASGTSTVIAAAVGAIVYLANNAGGM